MSIYYIVPAHSGLSGLYEGERFKIKNQWMQHFRMAWLMTKYDTLSIHLVSRYYPYHLNLFGGRAAVQGVTL